MSLQCTAKILIIHRSTAFGEDLLTFLTRCLCPKKQDFWAVLCCEYKIGEASLRIGHDIRKFKIINITHNENWGGRWTRYPLMQWHIST